MLSTDADNYVVSIASSLLFIAPASQLNSVFYPSMGQQNE